MNSACNCCSEPPCPLPVLEYLSISGVSGPCGWIAGDGDSFGTFSYGSGGTVGLPAPEFRRRYQTVTVTKNATYSAGGGPGYGFDDYSENAVTDEVSVWTRSVVSGVCTDGAVTGSYSFTRTVTGSYDPTPEGDYLLNQVETGSYTIVAGAWSGSGTRTATYAVSGEDVGSTGRIIFAGECGVTPCASSWSGSTWTRVLDNGTEVVAYSDPTPLIFPTWHTWETPEEDWEDGQGDLNTAVRTATEVITKVKYRVTHMPSGTCYLKAWVAQTFTPDPDPEAPPGTPDPTPVVTVVVSEWTGTGNPCIDDAALGVGAPENKVAHIDVVYDFEDVTGAGMTTFEILKYSCVPGYEPVPGDITKPNGYPAPGAV